MRFATIFSTAVGLYSTVVNAAVQEITVPAVIRSGEEFVANFTWPISQPRYQSITWGIGPPSALPGQVGAYGHVGVTRLDTATGGKCFLTIRRRLELMHAQISAAACTTTRLSTASRSLLVPMVLMLFRPSWLAISVQRATASSRRSTGTSTLPQPGPQVMMSIPLLLPRTRGVPSGLHLDCGSGDVVASM